MSRIVSGKPLQAPPISWQAVLTRTSPGPGSRRLTCSMVMGLPGWTSWSGAAPVLLANARFLVGYRYADRVDAALGRLLADRAEAGLAEQFLAVSDLLAQAADQPGSPVDQVPIG